MFLNSHSLNSHGILCCAPGDFLSVHDAMSSTLSDDVQSVMGSDTKEALVPSKSAKESQPPRWDAPWEKICWDMLGSSVGFDKLFLPIKRMRILQQFNSLLLLRIFHVDIMRDVYIHVPEYSLSRKSSSKTSELQTNVQGQFRHVHHITSLARAVYVWEMWGQ